MTSRFLYLARHGEAIDEGELSPAGRRQAELLAERLAGAGITSIAHGPLPRAAATAAIVAARLPGVPVRVAAVADDYVPFLPDPAPPALAGAVADEARAAAALERFARPSDVEVHELVITHSFQVAWFVRDALGAPPQRWVDIRAANAALTVIRYPADRAPAVLVLNDMSHLPPELRWTGFPDALRMLV